MRHMAMLALVLATGLTANAGPFITVVDPGSGDHLQFKVDTSGISEQQANVILKPWPSDERILQKGRKIVIRDPAKKYKGRATWLCLTCGEPSASFTIKALTVGDAIRTAQARCRSSSASLSLDLGKCVQKRTAR